MPNLTIGVLGLQGCIEPHRSHIEGQGARFLKLTDPEDLERIDGLILPGGESTVMLKLIHLYDWGPKLRATFERVPAWGICAGAILMARAVHQPEQESFGILDFEVERNAYGSQVHSFQTEIESYPVSFIRAPRIISVGAGVNVLATVPGREGPDAIWIEEGRHMATTFHPELTRGEPSPMHRAFLAKVRANAQ